MLQLDDRDRRLLDILQQGLPICERPYLAIAEALGDFTEAEVIGRVADLKGRGAIRRMTGFFQSDALGYRATLCAMKVPPANIAPMAAALDAIPGVTHNYLRDHPYNMWFTLIARDEPALRSIVDSVRQTGLAERVLRLDRTRQYKIRAVFSMGGTSE